MGGTASPKYLATQGINYYPISKNDDGSINFNDKTYKEQSGKIGKKFTLFTGYPYEVIGWMQMNGNNMAYPVSTFEENRSFTCAYVFVGTNETTYVISTNGLAFKEENISWDD